MLLQYTCIFSIKITITILLFLFAKPLATHEILNAGIIDFCFVKTISRILLMTIHQRFPKRKLRNSKWHTPIRKTFKLSLKSQWKPDLGLQYMLYLQEKYVASSADKVSNIHTVFLIYEQHIYMNLLIQIHSSPVIPQ